MDKVYLLTKENQDAVHKLADDIVSLTKGKYELQTIQQLKTDDVKLIWVLDALLEDAPIKKIVRKAEIMKEKICVVPGCGEKFISTSHSQKFCPEHQR